MTRCCNNRNVLHFSFAHFQRIIDFANSYNVLAGTNLIKVIVPTGSCHCLADKVQRLIRLHLEKRDSDPDKGSGMADDSVRLPDGRLETFRLYFVDTTESRSRGKFRWRSERRPRVDGSRTFN